MTIVEFLLARITEDEEAARAVAPLIDVRPWGQAGHVETISHARSTFASEDGYPKRVPDPEAAAHYSRHDPARVLAECEAKRRIVHISENAAERVPPKGDGYEEGRARQTLRLLALPYSDHPDYNPDWTPNLT